ncbi:hypothetical protein PFFCH_02089 [Plasmodium falciparum FCH/4]|uniref:Inositol polyphosphate-related phosphatase domain-containing protein n=1 Tax=Plasmodium falciparum FCH/4 TaxID=1036724 RepID=A0A024VQH4_PLAFA|nr:hypothetical protein PFFCH_02089 [Plasmodium falciparum FCH/4]
MYDNSEKNINIKVNNKKESGFNKNCKVHDNKPQLIINAKSEFNLKDENMNNISQPKKTLGIKFRSRSDAPFSRNIIKDNFDRDNYQNHQMASNDIKICKEENETQQSNVKRHTVGINLYTTTANNNNNNNNNNNSNNNNKPFNKFEKKKVLGYNYFTNRQKKILNQEDNNIIKNVPISIYVGTWNCEYFDFSKEYDCDKKRYSINHLNKNTQNDIYSMKLNERFSLRSLTPLVCMETGDKTIQEKELHTNNKNHVISLNNNTSVNNNQKYYIHNQKKEINNLSSTDTADVKSNSNDLNFYDISKINKDKNIDNFNIRNNNINDMIPKKVDNHSSNNQYYKEINLTRNDKSQLDNIKSKEYNILQVPKNYSDDQFSEGSSNESTKLSNNYTGNIKNQNAEQICNITNIKKKFFQTCKPTDTLIFSHWIQPYYDIYVICLQESISDNIINCLSMYLKEINQETYLFLPLADYKLSGYGDGAFLQMKSTTIAAWVRKSKLHPRGPVKLCASKSIAFNKLNNSKGCVSILLNIFNQFVLFIGCHMPAKDQEIRQKSREFILTKLSEYFSNKSTSNFKDVFHHVIWMGDFNFRVHGIHIEKVIHYLKTDNLKELLKHDEGHSAYSYDLSISFQELPINFLPTYKKNGNRPIINRSDTEWVQKEYKLIHNIKWYKGGKQETRIPSWTDRIFKWSCEKTKNCLVFVPNSYLSPIPEEKSIIMSSDHNPVSCCFQMFKMKNDEDIPLTKVTFAHIENRSIDRMYYTFSCI